MPHIMLPSDCLKSYPLWLVASFFYICALVIVHMDGCPKYVCTAQEYCEATSRRCYSYGGGPRESTVVDEEVIVVVRIGFFTKWIGKR